MMILVMIAVMPMIITKVILMIIVAMVFISYADGIHEGNRNNDDSNSTDETGNIDGSC